MRGRTTATAAALMLAACSGGPETAGRWDGSSLVRITVEETELGLIDPAEAHETAQAICAETRQRAVYFRGDDLGDRRLLHFRCE